MQKQKTGNNKIVMIKSVSDTVVRGVLALKKMRKKDSYNLLGVTERASSLEIQYAFDKRIASLKKSFENKDLNAVDTCKELVKLETALKKIK